ncbi:uncharacterized protein LOC110460913 [Mizuhopecten yessoensis]|uniref:Cyclic GMP-AMP synthase n=1 Tax=Mizuhopecten yessoensis TaxID=6573 RepID=A0A210Q1D2_MIZYE|nr:uncharacterized protein LOC110460913 [Mizuhopecten yessoensis]OWF42537.1 Cyclic GMP-AMP synthase [Mizuhopecten yessoensis]
METSSWESIPTDHDLGMELSDVCRVSRFLSRYLEGIDGIGSEETVRVRRLLKHLSWHYIYSHMKPYRLLYTGSSAEGLQLKGSDQDFMFIHNDVIVVQPRDVIHTVDADKTVLVMDHTNCRPGFTLLKLRHIGVRQHREVMDALIDINGSLHLSSVVYSSNVLWPDHYLHGPCSTVEIKGRLHDDAYCFHCRSWPDHLSNFRYRRRRYDWPSKTIINYIVQNGCHFVAIGDKHSNLSAMQWRISFSLSEKALVLKFNHVQFKTYALLKLFQKECIECNESIKSLLCSYFMKTIIFHAIERSPGSLWAEEYILVCFWFCIDILFNFVTNENCPNFFVTNHNMFLGNFTGDNRKKLLRVLMEYKRTGWKHLLQCPSLQPLYKTLQNSCSMYPIPKLPPSEEEFENDCAIIARCNSVYKVSTVQVLKLVNRAFLATVDEQEMDIVLLSFINVITNTSSNSIADLTRSHSNNNKATYAQIRRHKRVLHLSAATDVCRGLLSLATFYYNVGCYNKTTEIATCVVFACQRGGLLQWYGDYTRYKEEMCGKGYTLLQKAKRSFALQYTIHKEDNRLYPLELDLEVQTNERNIYLPPLPYATFLLLLSTYRLGNIDQSRTLLDDLQTLLSHPIYGVHHYPMVHNMVGIGHQMLGDTRRAIKAFKDSRRQLPENQAAAIRIADLRKSEGKSNEQTGSLGQSNVQTGSLGQSNVQKGSLDYCNVPSQYQKDENDDDNDDNNSCHHKTMHNIDPLTFKKLSWF